MVLQTRSRMNAQPTTHKLIVTGDIKSLNRPGIGEHPTHLFKGCFDSCVSPPHWGTRGRRFKSCRSDQSHYPHSCGYFKTLINCLLFNSNFSS